MPRPKVTSEFVRTPAASPVAIGSRVMAIIGLGSANLTIQEAIVKGGAGLKDDLGHTAVGTIIKIGNFKGTSDYSLTTDYLLSDGNTKIDWSPGGSEPTTGATYYVTYQYAKAPADYAPYLTDNMGDVLQKTGPISVTGGVLDTAAYLSQAAQIAFDIGVRQIIVCQISANTPAAFATAYSQLENPVNSVNPYYIVPMLGSLSTSGDFTTAKGTAITHVNKMASEEFGKERRLYYGLKDYVGGGLGVSDFTAEASAIANSRVTLSGNWNPVRVISIGAGTYTNVLDGCFDAVQLAAYRSTQFASEPMMNRAITGGFTGFNTRWGDTQIDSLVDGGVCVSEELSGIIKVVDDITTDISDEIEVDIATVEARDTLISGMRNAVEARFKGMRGDNTVSAQLKDFSNTYLDQRGAEGLIAAKGSVTASRQTGSLRKWQISFSYLPMTKVRDIKITFSVDLGLAA